MPAERLIGLASGVLPAVGPVQTVDAAGRAGFNAVGLWVDPDIWTPAVTRDVRQALNDHALVAIDVEVLWIRPGPLDDRLKRMIDIAAEVGAPNVLVVSSDPDIGATTAKFAALCDHGHSAGVRVSLEFMRFTEVKTIGQARGIAGQAGPAAAVLVDPLHLARSGGTAGDVVALPRDLIAYAQFCDAPLTGPDPDDLAALRTEALDGRLHVGEGALPLGDILDALPPLLPLSIELRSKALREGWPDPVDRARVTRAAMLRFLNQLAGERHDR